MYTDKEIAQWESDGYQFYTFHIRPEMMGGILRYINKGIPPGGFVKAVIQNDLRGAIEHADLGNQRNITAFIGFLVNKAPAYCWGSAENMSAWQARGGLEGYNEQT